MFNIFKKNKKKFNPEKGIRFDVLTIFPDFFDSFLKESLIQSGIEDGLLDINIHDLRDYSEGKHRVVDDRPFGGGSGMVYKVGPIYRAVEDLRRDNCRVILFTPRGEMLDQKRINDYADYDQIILICGRYEGVDERVAEHIADEVISVGDYVTLGGEVPAMTVVEAVSRLVPGVIGADDLLDERVREDGSFWEYEQYTRPRVFKAKNGREWPVPEVLFSGDHKRIKEWRKKYSEDVGR